MKGWCEIYIVYFCGDCVYVCYECMYCFVSENTSVLTISQARHLASIPDLLITVVAASMYFIKCTPHIDYQYCTKEIEF